MEVCYEPAITPPAASIFTRSTQGKMPATITIDRGDCESVDGKKEWSGKSMAQFEDAFSCAICCEVFTDPVKWPCGADAQRARRRARRRVAAARLSG